MGSANGKVLIVEDETLIRLMAKAEFEDAGFAVIMATDGADGLAALEQHRDIELLFTDIRMPGDIDGWALAKSARQINPNLPVIYASGFSDDQLQIVDGGLWFTKPYRLSNILGAATRLLGAQQ